jgi:hypothetical protein
MRQSSDKQSCRLGKKYRIIWPIDHKIVLLCHVLVARFSIGLDFRKIRIIVVRFFAHFEIGNVEGNEICRHFRGDLKVLSHVSLTNDSK